MAPAAETPRTRAWLDRLRRLSTAIGDARASRQALAALALNASTSFAAGIFLGSISNTFASRPGLFILVPPVIGLRGNIFTGVGSRLSTAIHTGTFSLSRNPRSVVGQNVLAAIVLTVAASVAFGFIGKGIAVAFGQGRSVPLGDFVVVSTVAGITASAIVLVGTVGIAAAAARRGWDLDNVGAPVVSSFGDVVSLPALWVAVGLAGLAILTNTLTIVAVAAAVVVVVLALRSPLDQLPRIVRQSLPVLTVAGAVSCLAGLAIERRLAPFEEHPALLVLLPAFLSSAGAIGGILSGRLATKLHLGLIDPTPVPGRVARRDIGAALALALPLLLFNAVGAHVLSLLVRHESPGLDAMVAVSLLGGVLTIAYVVVVAYYGTIASFRVGLDPDTYGIPLVTSTVDFTGAVALVLAIVMVGLG
jgi:mgtE-like transporter